MENNSEERRSREQWGKLFRLSVRHPAITLSVFLTTGLIFWGSVNWGMDRTNTESFCISCHEMKQNVYQEYKETIHYSNRTGVRATCPDCHVPKQWLYMVAKKAGATNEVFHKIIGSINTPEKFEAKRLYLAEHVWTDMRETDSRECRNCHTFTAMNLASQKKSSQLAHARALKNSQTCIDCHMGIAHHIAKDFDKSGELHEKYKVNRRPCADCHKGVPQPATW